MQRPTALGLFLCDQVLIDGETRKWTLVGSFNVAYGGEFPHVPPPFVAYAELTDGQGRMTLTLSVSDVDEEEQLATETADVDFDDPLATYHVRFRFPHLSFP